MHVSVPLFFTRIRKLFSILRQKSWRDALFTHRVAAGAEHAAVIRSMGKLSSVIDIGANRGQFALATRACCSDAFIVSFEPQIGPANTFEALFCSDEKTKLHRFAVGSQTSEATLHISGRDDSSSLLPISEKQNQLFAGTAGVGTQPVSIKKLSDCVDTTEILQPALLKVDVQGFELEALKGCDELIHCFDWVYIECSFLELYTGQALATEIISWLAIRKFQVRGAFHVHYDRDGSAIQADFLFQKAAEL